MPEVSTYGAQSSKNSREYPTARTDFKLSFMKIGLLVSKLRLKQKFKSCMNAAVVVEILKVVAGKHMKPARS